MSRQTSMRAVAQQQARQGRQRKYVVYAHVATPMIALLMLLTLGRSPQRMAAQAAMDSAAAAAAGGGAASSSSFSSSSSSMAPDGQIFLDLYTEATSAFNEGDLKTAERIFQQMSKSVSLAMPWTNLGIVYEKQYKLQKAKSAFRTAVKRYTDDTAAHLAYCRFGSSLLNRKVRGIVPNKELLAVCKRVTELEPDNIEGLVTWGSLYVLLTQYARAIPILEQAVGLATDEPHYLKQVLTNLALARLRAGQPREAILTANKLRALYGDIDDVVITLASIRSTSIPYDISAIEGMRSGLVTLVERFSMPTRHCPDATWSWLYGTESVVRKHPDDAEVEWLNEDEYGSLYGADLRLSFDTGRKIDPYYHTFHERRVGLLTLSHANMVGSSGIHLLGCNFLSGTSSWGSDMQDVPQEKQFVTVTTVTERVATVFPLKVPGNYYNWMCEGLLRAMVLQELVLDMPGNEDVKLLVPDPNAYKYIRESLEMLAIPMSRTLTYVSTVFVNLELTNTVFSVEWESVPNEKDTIGSLSHDPWSPFYPPRGLLQQLRTRLRDALFEYDVDYEDKPWLLMYASRDVSSHTGLPAIESELELVRLLKRLVPHEHFAVYRPNGTLTTELENFARAQIVVGPFHGGALSNMVICNSGTAMVYLPIEPNVENSYVHLAAALDLEHHVVASVNTTYYGSYGKLSKSKQNDVVNTVRAILKAKGLEANNQSGAKKVATKNDGSSSASESGSEAWHDAGEF